MKKTIAIMTVLAILPLGAFAASWSSVTIVNENEADVANVVEVAAMTGGNTSMGGSAINTIDGAGSQGDNSAMGGMGGEISTGDATIEVEITNAIGANETEIMPSTESSEATVVNANSAALANVVAALTDTGLNDGTAGDGVNALSASGSDSYSGGNTAEGGMGGMISTGASSVGVSIVNLLGSNITRIH